MLIQNSRSFWMRLFSSIFKIYLIFWPISMYSRHVYGSNIPLKYTVMLWYQQLYLRNKVSMFWACLFSKMFELCLFLNRRLLSREYGIQNPRVLCTGNKRLFCNLPSYLKFIISNVSSSVMYTTPFTL